MPDAGVRAMSMDEPLHLSLLDEIELGTFVGNSEEAEVARVKKREAIEMLQRYGVFEDVPSSQADEEGLKLIRARREHQQRPEAEDKWGYVAQEFIPTWEDPVESLRHAAALCDV